MTGTKNVSNYLWLERSWTIEEVLLLPLSQTIVNSCPTSTENCSSKSSTKKLPFIAGRDNYRNVPPGKRTTAENNYLPSAQPQLIDPHINFYT